MKKFTIVTLTAVLSLSGFGKDVTVASNTIADVAFTHASLNQTIVILKTIEAPSDYSLSDGFMNQRASPVPHIKLASNQNSKFSQILNQAAANLVEESHRNGEKRRKMIINTLAEVGRADGLALAPNGSLYVASGNFHVRRVASDGTTTIIAGGGRPADGIGDGGLANAAALSNPTGLAVAPDGRLYIAEGSRIRRVGLDGIITTVAGTGRGGFSGDGGPATAATLSGPHGLAIAPDGGLYISETLGNRIRRVGPDGIITTIAGGGRPADGIGDGGPATAAALDVPTGLAVVPEGGLYIAERLNRIRRVGPDGIISTVAGTGRGGFSGDGGPATVATLSRPEGLAVAPDGSLYIADSGNHRIRRIGPDGIITTVAGTVIIGSSGDGYPADSAGLSSPSDVALGPNGTIYIAEGSRIRLVSDAGPRPSSLEAIDHMDNALRDQILQEAEKYHHNCITNSMERVFYDCGCLALHYIDTRLEMGPNVDQSLVLFKNSTSLEIGRRCVDPASIAAYHRERCSELIAGYNKPNQDQICSCFGDEMVHSFLERPIYDIQVMVNMPAEAYGVCGLHGPPRPRKR